MAANMSPLIEDFKKYTRYDLKVLTDSRAAMARLDREDLYLLIAELMSRLNEQAPPSCS